ncbi:CpaF family protein, partial [Mesorhizobium sp. M8A.F.Ca.ET.213.01.1.1]
MLGRFIKGPGEQRTPQSVQAPVTSNGAVVVQPVQAEPASDDFLSLKVDLHRHLIDRFNLTALENASKDEILNEIRPIVREFVRVRNVPLNARELDQLTSDTADE